MKTVLQVFGGADSKFHQILNSKWQIQDGDNEKLKYQYI